jgi:hypothetical protein
LRTGRDLGISILLERGGKLPQWPRWLIQKAKEKNPKAKQAQALRKKNFESYCTRGYRCVKCHHHLLSMFQHRVTPGRSNRVLSCPVPLVEGISFNSIAGYAGASQCDQSLCC